MKGSYNYSYNALKKMDISEKDARYLVNTFNSLWHSPINYIFGYQKVLNSKIKGALEKKLIGKEALDFIEKDLVIRCYKK